MNKVLIVLVVITLLACNKDKRSIYCYDNLVVNFDSSIEKLGWILETPNAGWFGTRAVPTNLPEEYKIINLPVKACITPSIEKFHSLNMYYPKSEITSIERR